MTDEDRGIEWAYALTSLQTDGSEVLERALWQTAGYPLAR